MRTERVAETGDITPLSAHSRADLEVAFRLLFLALLGMRQASYSDLRRLLGVTDRSVRRAVASARVAGLVVVALESEGGRALVKLTPLAVDLLRSIGRHAAKEIAA